MAGYDELPRTQYAEGAAALSYLESRLREEADAAAQATSLEATLAHVMLATAYAKRLNESSTARLALAADSWVQENRIW